MPPATVLYQQQQQQKQKPLLTCLGYLALLLIGDTHKKEIINVNNK